MGTQFVYLVNVETESIMHESDQPALMKDGAWLN
jgi:hypothetical protein